MLTRPRRSRRCDQPRSARIPRSPRGATEARFGQRRPGSAAAVLWLGSRHRPPQASPTAKLQPIASQPLAPQGFTSVERQRLRREAERAGLMADAIVTTLLNTGVRVHELVRLSRA